MFERLRAICVADTENLAELADIAAPFDAAFFDGAEFNGADLRHTDLRKYSLRAAVFNGATIDETTIFMSKSSNISPTEFNNWPTSISDLLGAINVIYDTQISKSLIYLKKRNRETFVKTSAPSVSKEKRNTRRDYKTDSSIAASVTYIKNLTEEIKSNMEQTASLDFFYYNINLAKNLNYECKRFLERYDDKLLKKLSRDIYNCSDIYSQSKKKNTKVKIEKKSWILILRSIYEYHTAIQINSTNDAIYYIAFCSFVIIEYLNDIIYIMSLFEKNSKKYVQCSVWLSANDWEIN